MQAQKLLQTIAARQVLRRYAHHAHELPKPAGTYNDLPTPEGSFQTQYEANNRRYNGRLALGVGFLIGTILFGKAAGFFDLNYTTPLKPAQIDSYRD